MTADLSPAAHPTTEDHMTTTDLARAIERYADQLRDDAKTTDDGVAVGLLRAADGLGDLLAGDAASRTTAYPLPIHGCGHPTQQHHHMAGDNADARSQDRAVRELTAELEKTRATLARTRQQRDRYNADLTDVGNEIDQLAAERDKARRERDDYARSRNRFADLLQSTAAALHMPIGDEGWWDGIPAAAAGVTADLDQAINRADRLDREAAALRAQLDQALARLDLDAWNRLTARAEKAERERDSLARRLGVRWEELEKTRAFRDEHRRLLIATATALGMNGHDRWAAIPEVAAGVTADRDQAHKLADFRQRVNDSLRQDLSDAGDVIAAVREALENLAPLVDDTTGRIPYLPNARAAVEHIRRTLAAYDAPQQQAPPSLGSPADRAQGQADDLTDRLAAALTEARSTHDGSGVRPGTLERWRLLLAEHADRAQSTAPPAETAVETTGHPAEGDREGDTGPKAHRSAEAAGYRISIRTLYRDGLGAIRVGDRIASVLSTRPTVADAVDELRRAINIAGQRAEG